ncbi:MAG: hypothetical protein WC595_06925, partial [Candidatus Nanoarchaeia archaeon]
KRVVHAAKVKAEQLKDADDGFSPSRWLDPLNLAKIRLDEQLKKVPFLDQKKLGQGYHPKRFESSVPVPRLWELKPIKKLEKQIKISDIKSKLIRQARAAEEEIKEQFQSFVAPAPRVVIEHFPLHKSHVQRSLLPKRVSPESSQVLLEKMAEVFKI